MPDTIRLRGPDIVPGEEDAFQYDRLGFRRLADKLTQLLQVAEPSPVRFVDAERGQGKSTFCRLWCADVASNHAVTPLITIDAHRHDFQSDAFVVCAARVLEHLKAHSDHFLGSETSTFEDRAVRVATRIGTGLVQNLISTVTAGVLSQDVQENAVAEYQSASAHSIELFYREALGAHTQLSKAEDDFKETLGNISAQLKKSTGLPLTILVDELDRCRPAFALQMLERLKHYFDVSNVAFVLMLNFSQLKHHVLGAYGSSMDAEGYLLKFCDKKIDFCANTRANEIGPITSFTELLINNYNAEDVTDNSDLTHRFLMQVFTILKLTLRQQKSVLSDYNLIKCSDTYGFRQFRVFAVFLIAISKTSPDVIAHLQKNRPHRGLFDKVIDLNSVAQSHISGNVSHIWNLIRHLVSNESERESYDPNVPAQVLVAPHPNKDPGSFACYVAQCLDVVSFEGDSS